MQPGRVKSWKETFTDQFSWGSEICNVQGITGVGFVLISVLRKFNLLFLKIGVFVIDNFLGRII
jgi:hypothetical protein